MITNETPDLLKSEPMSTEDRAGLLVEFLIFSFFKHYILPPSYARKAYQ